MFQARLEETVGAAIILYHCLMSFHAALPGFSRQINHNDSFSVFLLPLDSVILTIPFAF